MVKSESDGLNAIEYWAGNKVHAPILFKYSSVSGLPEDDMYWNSQVLDVDIVHHISIEEEEKLDKKTVSVEIRNKSRKKYKDLIKKTTNLINCDQYVLNYAEHLGLDLTSNFDNFPNTITHWFIDLEYIDQIPTIKDKPFTFIDTFDQLYECVRDLSRFQVLGVDLEFHGDKRIFIGNCHWN